MSVHTVRSPVRRIAAEHPGLVRFGRAGWFAKGVVYVVAGVLALLIVAKSSGFSTAATTGTGEASPTGALKTIAETSSGPILLALLVVGLLLYAAWRVVSALLPGRLDAKSTAKRIGFAVSAVMYVTFAVTAFSLARGGSTSSANGNSTVSKTSGGVMQHTGGRVLIGAVGVIVIAVGLYRVVKGLRRDVDDELDLSAMPAARRRRIERLGGVGEVGRGVGIGLIGYFLLDSALTYDPQEATGLDGALRTLVTKTGGQFVVLVVAVGFISYGLFCVATFTHRRLETP